MRQPPSDDQRSEAHTCPQHAEAPLFRGHTLADPRPVSQATRTLVAQMWRRAGVPDACGAHPSRMLWSRTLFDLTRRACYKVHGSGQGRGEATWLDPRVTGV